MITIHEKAEKMLKESNFKIFKHKKLLCCVQRLSWSGHLCGYVAVDKNNSLYGKKYSDTIELEKEPKFNENYIGLLIHSLKDRKDNEYSLDLAINVHCGLTYSRNELNGLEKNIFGDLWWFGFDTGHSEDLKPFQTDIDRKYPYNECTYKDFEFVENETKKLAEQLSKFNNK